tara:strand:+ start:121 stop:435 length:315 start_codon:yes stop_codon:yes gene_type:complete
MRIVQTAEIHPLDKKKPFDAWGSLMQIDEGNYHQQVRRAVTTILEEVDKMSEKDFKRVDAMMNKADHICRRKDNVPVILQCKLDGKRPQLCAEILFDQMRRRQS